MGGTIPAREGRQRKGGAGGTWQAEFECLRDAAAPVLVASGRLGTHAAPRFAEALAGAEAFAAPGLVLDLAGVDYVSGAPLRVLRTAAERLSARGGRLVLCGVDEAVRLGIEIADLGDHVDIVSTRAEAIARASAAERAP